MAVSFASSRLITAASMAASFQSDNISLVQKGGFSIHAIFTGAPVGSIYVAVSIDGSNWIVLSDSAATIIAAGDVFYNVTDSKYKLARLHYAFTSGSGSMDAFFSTKEVV
jgi:hypothetical protein